MAIPIVNQVAWVVKDLQASMALYGQLFGQWNVFEADIDDATYRGKTESCRLRIALAKSGDMEIELIQPDGGKGPHQEFLDKGRSGLNHIRFESHDIDADIKDFESKGFSVVWFKRWDEDTVCCYLESDNDEAFVELLQMPGQ